jgi:monoamine oxidase
VKAHGRDVVLLEARDRVGGRTWKKQAADGSGCSMGGTWLGVGHDRMFALCKEFGFEVYPQYEQGETIMQLGGKNARYAGRIPKIGPLALGSLGLAFRQARSNGQGRSARGAVECQERPRSRRADPGRLDFLMVERAQRGC